MWSVQRWILNVTRKPRQWRRQSWDLALFYSSYTSTPNSLYVWCPFEQWKFGTFVLQLDFWQPVRRYRLGLPVPARWLVALVANILCLKLLSNRSCCWLRFRFYSASIHDPSYSNNSPIQLFLRKLIGFSVLENIFFHVFSKYLYVLWIRTDPVQPLDQTMSIPGSRFGSGWEWLFKACGPSSIVNGLRERSTLKRESPV